MHSSKKIILMLDPSRSADRGIIRGITDYTRQRGSWTFFRHTPLFQQAPFSRTTQTNLVRRLTGLEADGIIGYLPSSRSLLNTLLKHKFPIVAIPLKTPFPGVINVLQDPSIGAKGAEHLKQKGFENFAFYGDESYWSGVRLQGFKEYLQRQATPFKFFCYSAIRRSGDPEQKRLRAWLRTLPKPVGLMTSNDERSLDLIEACHETELRIPDDIAIVGVDNDDMICGLSRPPLTSIELNSHSVGYRSAETLDRLIHHKPIDSTPIQFQPLEVVIRQSTDILAVSDPEVARAIRFIHNNACRNIHVSDVITEASLSLRTLQMRFKKAIGRSIHQEIRLMRIQQFAHALIRTSQTVSEIAYKLDFPDINHISRIFRKEMGMTPLEYRKVWRS